MASFRKSAWGFTTYGRGGERPLRTGLRASATQFSESRYAGAVPGFSLNEADVIKGNFIDKTVTWQGNADVSSLAGKPIQLHFVMRDAKLYAFRFNDTATQVTTY